MNIKISFGLLSLAIIGLIISPITISETFAEKGGNEKSQGVPQGCENGNGRDAEQNPNCDNSTPNEKDTDNDGIPDSEDACPHKKPIIWLDGEPDHDGDGTTDAQEEIDGTNPCK